MIIKDGVLTLTMEELVQAHTIEIDGIRFSRQLFKALANIDSVGHAFAIRSNHHGVIDLCRLDPSRSFDAQREALTPTPARQSTTADPKEPACDDFLVEFDKDMGLLRIEGQTYTNDLFKALANVRVNTEQWIKMRRREDGAITLSVLSSEPPENRLRQDLEMHVLRAFKPGDVVVSRLKGPVSEQYYQRIVAMCARAREETGVTFVILDNILEPISRDAEVSTSESRGEPR